MDKDKDEHPLLQLPVSSWHPCTAQGSALSLGQNYFGLWDTMGQDCSQTEMFNEPPFSAWVS